MLSRAGQVQFGTPKKKGTSTLPNAVKRRVGALTAAVVAGMMFFMPGSATASPSDAPRFDAAPNCHPVPAEPSGYRWSGSCWSGPQGSGAGESCARTGSEGQEEGQWGSWRCLGNLRADNLFYYHLYIR